MSRTTIEKLVPGGEGFGRLEDGRPVFVPGAFPGDVVRIERLTAKKQFARAEEWGLEESSSLRREAPCPVFHRCGGCDWMVLSEGEQKQRKLALLAEALRRTGRFTEALPLSVSEVGPEIAYRQRVRLHFDERGSLGYFARRSHDVVSARSCQVVATELAAAIAELEAVVSAETAAFGAFADVEVRALGEQRSLAFTLRRGKTVPKYAIAPLRRRFLVRVDGEPVGRRSHLGNEMATNEASSPLERWPSNEGVYLLAAPGDFTQVNWVVNRAIVDELVNGAVRRRAETFLDLYCGVGNFSLPLLAAGLLGHGLDDNASSIASARRAALAQALPEGCFTHQDVARWLADASREPYDLVVIDPPRSGIHADLESIARLCRRALFLCSCDPVTFARDLRRLVDLGFAVQSVTLYDMFPQTHHFEVVCWLEPTA